jgi:hypothetical protein
LDIVLGSIVCGRKYPRIGRVRQAGLYGILFDITNDSQQFFVIPHAMIVRFVLPKSAGSAQAFVASSRGIPLNALHDLLARRAKSRTDFQSVI